MYLHFKIHVRWENRKSQHKVSTAIRSGRQVPIVRIERNMRGNSKKTFKFDNPRICRQESLCDNLTVDTCLECLVLADLHNAEELKNASVKFVVEHSEEFVDQVKWMQENFENIMMFSF